MRIFIVWLLAATCYSVTCETLQADCVSMPTGMVAWWRAETNANDSVGNHHGALDNGTSFASGQVGTAFSFDGTNDFVSVGDTTDWNFGTNDFTIEFWTKLNVLKNSMFIHRLDGSIRVGLEFD